MNKSGNGYWMIRGFDHSGFGRVREGNDREERVQDLR